MCRHIWKLRTTRPRHSHSEISGALIPALSVQPFQINGARFCMVETMKGGSGFVNTIRQKPTLI